MNSIWKKMIISIEPIWENSILWVVQRRINTLWRTCASSPYRNSFPFNAGTRTASFPLGSSCPAWPSTLCSRQIKWKWKQIVVRIMVWPYRSPKRAHLRRVSCESPKETSCRIQAAPDCRLCTAPASSCWNSLHSVWRPKWKHALERCLYSEMLHSWLTNIPNSELYAIAFSSSYWIESIDTDNANSRMSSQVKFDIDNLCNISEWQI